MSSRGRFPQAPSGDHAVGYRKPPAQTRFKKGQSGNPRGRPAGKRAKVPYESVLGQSVAVRLEGKQRRIAADQAFVLHLTKSGLAGDVSAQRPLYRHISEMLAEVMRLTEDLSFIVEREVILWRHDAVHRSAVQLWEAVSAAYPLPPAPDP